MLSRVNLRSSSVCRKGFSSRILSIQPYRSFNYSFRSFQEQQKPSSSEDPPKKRPLSRVAIGGNSDSNKKEGFGMAVEFATWKAVLVLLVFGGAGTYYFQQEKERLRQQREMEANKPIGTPLIGGHFTLEDTKGNKFTHENLVDPNLKRFSILYFGFTHCPDVCPEELDKLGEMLDKLERDGVPMQPVFITCDPARDTPAVLDAYLADFHPGIIGLTGTYEQVKNCCKKFRVYFSTPPNVKPGQDYLVDHSIFFYLIDPEGNFVDVIGREAGADEGALKISKYAKAFIPEKERIEKKEGFLGFLYK
ncbi:SCO1 Protein SCO1 [Candida maltosa Xu316]|uniref:Copper-binding protein of the mitochondrial inner membrane, putative n=1 Tax=Candida maltosa (strain Xu316) TaxID=1245528 RepID=M3K3G8_CANMX|nr:Copper-binding protein of the mitochondrial inner membrane,  putative [Candida maltosa Xu316]